MHRSSPGPRPHERIEAATLTPRERYQLLTSLVVPRPIGWISSLAAAGAPNLAPFSFFNLVSTSPPYVVVSIGVRPGGEPKDTLANILATGAFCVNVVSQELLVAMNVSSGTYASSVDEFAVAGLTSVPAESVSGVYVGQAPAVLECRLQRSVELPGSPNTLIVGEVVLIRVAEDLPCADGSRGVDPTALRPVGRLGGAGYALPGQVVHLARPVVPED